MYEDTNWRYTKIEFTGDAHSIEKAIETLEKLPGMANAAAAAKAVLPQKAATKKRKPKS